MEVWYKTATSSDLGQHYNMFIDEDDNVYTSTVRG